MFQLPSRHISFISSLHMESKGGGFPMMHPGVHQNCNDRIISGGWVTRVCIVALCFSSWPELKSFEPGYTQHLSVLKLPEMQHNLLHFVHFYLHFTLFSRTSLMGSSSNNTWFSFLQNPPFFFFFCTWAWGDNWPGCNFLPQPPAVSGAVYVTALCLGPRGR